MQGISERLTPNNPTRPEVSRMTLRSSIPAYNTSRESTYQKCLIERYEMDPERNGLNCPRYIGIGATNNDTLAELKFFEHGHGMRCVALPGGAVRCGAVQDSMGGGGYENYRTGAVQQDRTNAPARAEARQ